MRVQPDRSRPHWPDRHAHAGRYSRRRVQLLHRRAVLTWHLRHAGVLHRKSSKNAAVFPPGRETRSLAVLRLAALCSVARLAVAVCAVTITENSRVGTPGILVRQLPCWG